ncbi:MAG: leucine-rich repeat protein, partial [Clostridium sp.]|nr:leucine-rich repeat protein [Clostridium sp.]
MKSNKKQIISILAVLTMAILLSCAFVACNKVDTDKTGTDIVADYKVTIHPNNGQGDIIWDITKEIPTITKDGYHIAGYFLDAQLTISTTLESLKATGITKNIDVYVKWEEDVCEHVAVTDAAVEPTCTEKGLTEGKHCSKCGKILKAQTEIDALGHDLENHDGQEATCTEKGWKAYVTCKREGCGYTTYNEIPALGHKYSKDWSTDKTYHWHASTCGHDVVSDKGKHTFDSNWVCTECAYVDTGLHGVELRTNTLELNGTDIYGKVSNATSTFSFINEIAIADSATYIVSTDINGSNVIRTKTVSLGIGDNTFYILVENGKDLGLYTVVIRRRPMYSVSFNVNGGTSVSSQTIEEDYLATEPTTERKGYTFDKWDYDFSKPIIKDTSITASWNIITYNVYYDLNVPSDSISQDVDNSMNVTTYTVEDVITFQTPSRKGYRFTGWDKNIKKGTIGDVTVTASWEVIEYDIVYDFGDADSVSKATNNTQNPSKYTIENTITFVEPSRTGYTFIAWDKNIVRGTIDTQIITASWKIVEYDIIYDFGDNNSVSKATNNEHNPSKYTIEDAITVAEPSRKGYTFIAWDKSIASGTIGTQTITASWKIIEYSIIYDFGDTDSVSKATNNAQNPSKYTIEDAITFAEPSRRGYTFIAWDKSIEKGTINTQTITAIWEVINYSITYELNGWENSSQNVDTYTIESGIITLYDAIKGESLFCGWYLDEECKNHIATIDASTMRDYMVYAYTDDSATKGLSIEKGSVKGYSGTLTDVVIPSYYKGNRVTSIGDRAFYNCTGLTSITIPDSVTSIGKETFSNCIDLTNVTIGNGVTSIGDSAFYGCSKLQDLYITDIMAWCNISGLNNLMWYGSSNKRLYINNELVTSITIPDSVTSIGGYAFSFCTGLTSVVIPDSVTSIGERAFRNCSGLTSITIPDSVMSIGMSAFHGCIGLTSVTIGNSVTSIGEYAFDGCYKLIEVYNKSALSITAGSYSNGKVACYAKNVYTNEGGSKLTTDENEYVIYTDEYENILVSYRGTERELILPSYITKINQYAFYRCTGLTSVTIPDSVTSISSSAFSGCKGLTSVTIGESVTSIGWGAFSGCSGLTSVTIPNSVTSIGSSSFWGCTGLTSIIVDEGNTKYHSAGNCLIETATKTLLSGCKTSEIPSDGSVTSIGDDAFRNCSGLTSITIPDSVMSIGMSAFHGCIGLTSV